MKDREAWWAVGLVVAESWTRLGASSLVHPTEFMRQAETKDLGLFAAALAPGQTSPLATEYKETKGAKSNPL